MNILFLASFFALLFTNDVQASSCCSGASAVPQLILADDIVSFSIMNTSLETQYDEVFVQSWTGRMDGVVVPLDRVQVNVGADWAQKTFVADRGLYFSQFRVGLSYEALPELLYNPVVPRAFWMIHANIPLGADTVVPLASGLGTGVFLTKSWNEWDAFTSQDLSYDFGVRQEDGTIERSQAWKWAPVLGAGYSLSVWSKSIRLGGSVSGVFALDRGEWLETRLAGDVAIKALDPLRVLASVGVSPAVVGGAGGQWWLGVGFSLTQPVP